MEDVLHTKKILSFIVNNNRLLLLKNNSVDPKHGGDFWYTVTGGFNSKETDSKIVCKREIKEETNLDVEECIYLNLILNYTHDGINCYEYVHISFVNNTDNIILDEKENVDYRWCNIDEYIDNIKWYGDLELLKQILKLAINKELYLRCQVIEKV